MYLGPGHNDLPPGYSSRYSPPPLELRAPPPPGPPPCAQEGAPLVYDYSHGGEGHRNSHGRIPRPSSPHSRGSFSEYSDRHQVHDSFDRRLDRAALPPRRPRSPAYEYAPSPSRPPHDDFPSRVANINVQHRNRGPPLATHDDRRGQLSPRRRIPSPSELYGPPETPGRYYTPSTKGTHYAHVRRGSPSARRASPPRHRDYLPLRDTIDHLDARPSTRLPPPPSYEPDRSPAPRRISPAPPRDYCTPRPKEGNSLSKHESPLPPYRRVSPSSPFQEPPVRRASPPQAYKDPGPHSPPPSRPGRRLTPSPYRSPSPEREAFVGHVLAEGRRSRSRDRNLTQFRDGYRDSNERIPEQFRDDYRAAATSKMPTPPRSMKHSKAPRSPSGSPFEDTLRNYRTERKVAAPMPMKRPRSLSREHSVDNFADYPKGICKEWFDTGICRKPIGGCFLAHSLPESPRSKHRRKKQVSREREGGVGSAEGARRGDKKTAIYNYDNEETPREEEHDVMHRDRRRADVEKREVDKKLCREWAVGACDNPDKKCKRRHFFINDEADYYNDINASQTLPSEIVQKEHEGELDYDWQNWLHEQTNNWIFQKRLNEKRAEEDARMGQTNAAAAIMRRQMEEYQEQMQTWMVDMNEWMKTQRLSPEKLREMKDMIKQQMEQVKQVAQSADFMASHGPGVLPIEKPPRTTSNISSEYSVQQYAASASSTGQAGPLKQRPLSVTASVAPEVPPGPLPSGSPRGFPAGVMPPFDPKRPPPSYHAGHTPPIHVLPPGFQTNTPPPGYAAPLSSINSPAPSQGVNMHRRPSARSVEAPVDGVGIPQKYKPCFNFRRGKCHLTEEECPYSHSIERRDKPCIAFNQASCRFDADCCTYQHVCKLCGGPEPLRSCGCQDRRSPDRLSDVLVERLKKRLYWKEMEKIAKSRGEKTGLWKANRSPSPEICSKWNDKGLNHCSSRNSCRLLHRCKSCWGPNPYINCSVCNIEARPGGSKDCDEFETAAGCARGLACNMIHRCSKCKLTFLEFRMDCRCYAPELPVDSDSVRGCPMMKHESGNDIKYVKDESQDKPDKNAAFPKDICRMFNLGICRNENCNQKHRCSKCLKINTGLMTCTCLGAREFRNTISSGVKESKKPDLPLGGCIKFNLSYCSEGCEVGHHCAICLGKNPAKICACQGAKDLRKSMAMLEQYETRKKKKNQERRDRLGWPEDICREFNIKECTTKICKKLHSCVKCGSSSAITSCVCEAAAIFRADVDGEIKKMDQVTEMLSKEVAEKSTDLNYIRGGWPRGVCKNFNVGTCPFPTCKYFHKCGKCLGPDPMQSCPCFGGEDYRDSPTLERELMDGLTVYDVNISTLLSYAQKSKNEKHEKEIDEEKFNLKEDGWTFIQEICIEFNKGSCPSGVSCKKRHVCSDCQGPYPVNKCARCIGKVKNKFVCNNYQTEQCHKFDCPFPHRCSGCMGPSPRCKCSCFCSPVGFHPPRTEGTQPLHPLPRASNVVGSQSILGPFPGTPGILGPAPGFLHSSGGPSHMVPPSSSSRTPIMSGSLGPGTSTQGQNTFEANGEKPEVSEVTNGDNGAECEEKQNDNLEEAEPENMQLTDASVDPGNSLGFVNDGSFAEIAAATIEQQKREVTKQGAQSSIGSGVNKRVGGKSLKTGVVMKTKKPEDKVKDGGNDDAWSKYMEEVKKMSGNVCERGLGGNNSVAK